MKKKCLTEIVPSVDNSSIECCGITASNCVTMSEVDTFLKTIKGDTLTDVIHAISDRLALQNVKLFKNRDFIANVTQTGTSAPVFDFILDNSFTGNFTPAYVGVGEYTLTAPTGSFDLIKTFKQMPSNTPQLYSVEISVTSTTVINIKTRNSVGVLADGLLDKTPLTIKTPF